MKKKSVAKKQRVDYGRRVRNKYYNGQVIPVTVRPGAGPKPRKGKA